MQNILKSVVSPSEIVPGITSAIAVLAYAGIPVTHRGVSVSFKVVTGYEAKNKKQIQVNWESMKADETIVFLMGLHNLAKITKNLIKIGKSKKPLCCYKQRYYTRSNKYYWHS